jgi:hypothetical protein
MTDKKGAVNQNHHTPGRVRLSNRIFKKLYGWGWSDPRFKP